MFCLPQYSMTDLLESDEPSYNYTVVQQSVMYAQMYVYF